MHKVCSFDGEKTKFSIHFFFLFCVFVLGPSTLLNDKFYRIKFVLSFLVNLRKHEHSQQTKFATMTHKMKKFEDRTEFPLSVEANEDVSPSKCYSFLFRSCQTTKYDITEKCILCKMYLSSIWWNCLPAAGDWFILITHNCVASLNGICLKQNSLININQNQTNKQNQKMM